MLFTVQVGHLRTPYRWLALCLLIHLRHHTRQFALSWLPCFPVYFPLMVRLMACWYYGGAVAAPYLSTSMPRHEQAANSHLLMFVPS